MATTHYTTPGHENTALALIGERLTRRRIDLNFTQAELAQRAGVGKRTLERLEAGGSTQLTNFLRVLRELRLLDELLAAIPDAQPGPMDLLRSKKAERKRVRHQQPPGTVKENPEPSGWTWGDG